MSTYNGEKYIREQLDSILSQIGVELSVLIRDDGSSDSTLSIIEDYVSQHKNIKFYAGENIKPAQSFMDLIYNSPNADYYALSDQDDVWDPDKLKCAIDFLSKTNPDKPAMYFSNLRIVDQDLNLYRLSHSSPRGHDNKYHSLTDTIATGCTIVFNNTAWKYLRKKRPTQISMHDTWIYMVCKMFGEAVYDPCAHIDYRQHGNNVIGTYLGKKTLSLYWKRIKRLFNRELQPRYNNAVSFLNCYGDLLSVEDMAKVKKLVEYKKSVASKIRLWCDRDLWPKTKGAKLRYFVLIMLEII